MERCAATEPPLTDVRALICRPVNAAPRRWRSMRPAGRGVGHISCPRPVMRLPCGVGPRCRSPSFDGTAGALRYRPHPPWRVLPGGKAAGMAGVDWRVVAGGHGCCGRTGRPGGAVVTTVTGEHCATSILPDCYLFNSPSPCGWPFGRNTLPSTTKPSEGSTFRRQPMTLARWYER